MYRSLVELIAELHANSLSDLPALAAHPVDLAASDSVTDLPSSRARNSPGETSSYFSFKRWYGALGQPGSGTDGQGETGQSSDEVTQQFRRAIRRAREADGTASTASSCSSESYDTCVDSPASSTTTWTTSPGESGAQKDAGGIESTPFPSGYGAEDSPPPLRAAQSVATLRRPSPAPPAAPSPAAIAVHAAIPGLHHRCLACTGPVFLAVGTASTVVYVHATRRSAAFDFRVPISVVAEEIGILVHFATVCTQTRDAPHAVTSLLERKRHLRHVGE